MADKDYTDLFENSSYNHEPLAARMRPRTLDEYIGQDHIVGKGRLLRRAIAADQLTSVIFYGPPGSGKTTLARVIANHTSSNFLTLNAVLTGVADIRKAISDAENQRKLYSKKTILFVDEVHRWNKSQQDALLPWVENGTIILIGATTENPFFEVNKALVSRSRVFQLKPLTQDDLANAARQAIEDTERGYGHWKVEFEKGALEHLIETANGDARSLLNALELAVETTPEKWAPKDTPPKPSYGSTIYISKETAEESIQKKVVLYDKDGDYHYDIISAFIKSLRGRDPDAACYWMARMIRAGEDPDFIFRRMLISACEDTGLADPHAVEVVLSCAQAFDRVGMPEGRYFLTHAALYLATAPKSNSSMAFFDALSAVEKEDAEVPNHLRDGNRDAEGFGHGSGYLYPHAYRDHWVAQQYLPNSLVGKVFYTPSTQGYENIIREDVLARRELQIAAILNEEESSSSDPNLVNVSAFESNMHFNGYEKTEENLTFTPSNPAKEKTLSAAEKSWRSRLESNKAEILLSVRNQMTKSADLLRHHRNLIWNADDALLIFELTRKSPEGLTCGVCRTKKGIDLLTQYASTLEDLDKPQLTQLPENSKPFSDGSFYLSLKDFGNIQFDNLFFRDCISSKKDIEDFVECMKNAFYGIEKKERDIAFEEDSALFKNMESYVSKDGKIILSQQIPCHAQRLSLLIRNQIFNSKIPDEHWDKLLTAMNKEEEVFYTNTESPLFNWDSQDILNTFKEKGFTTKEKLVLLSETRRLTPMQIENWLKPNSSYSEAIKKGIGESGIEEIKALLLKECNKMLFKWQNEVIFLTAFVNS